MEAEVNTYKPKHDENNRYPEESFYNRAFTASEVVCGDNRRNQKRDLGNSAERARYRSRPTDFYSAIRKKPEDESQNRSDSRNRQSNNTRRT